jgi:hypothetical protein
MSQAECHHHQQCRGSQQDQPPFRRAGSLLRTRRMRRKRMIRAKLKVIGLFGPAGLWHERGKVSGTGAHSTMSSLNFLPKTKRDFALTHEAFSPRSEIESRRRRYLITMNCLAM